MFSHLDADVPMFLPLFKHNMFEAKNLIAKQSTHGVARTRIMVKKALKELQKTAGGTASAEAGSKMVIVKFEQLGASNGRMLLCLILFPESSCCK